MALHFDILTIFPGMFAGILEESILGRSLRAGLLEVDLLNLRDFTHDRHRSVDDRPYGGGPGMVFKPEPVFEAVDHVLAAGRAPAAETRKIILTPQGRRLVQSDLRELARARWIILLCGHYEGFDERIITGLDFEQVSIGDYVLSGGEIPAMVLLDGVARLLPGALGHPESAAQESFEEGLLDYPQYTRPPEYRGLKVPEVLLSGDHARIARWRRQEALRRTAQRRSEERNEHPSASAVHSGPYGPAELASISAFSTMVGRQVSSEAAQEGG
jgi:tRNA (guanine37-N1)-methyltransferase